MYNSMIYTAALRIRLTCKKILIGSLLLASAQQSLAALPSVGVTDEEVNGFEIAQVDLENPRREPPVEPIAPPVPSVIAPLEPVAPPVPPVIAPVPPLVNPPLEPIAPPVSPVITPVPPTIPP